MDWSKAKNILIVALIITNIFLLIVYGGDRVKQLQAQRELEADTAEFLAQKQIKVEAEIPDEQPRMSILRVRPAKVKATFRGSLEDYLKDQVLWSDDIEIGPNTAKIKVEDWYLEECELVYKGSEDGLRAVAGNWAIPTEFGQQKRRTKSATSALLDFAQDYAADEAITVENIQMVYYLDCSSYDTQLPLRDTALPSWKITFRLDASPETKVNAYISAFEE